MTVRREDRGKGALGREGKVDISRDEVAWDGFERDVLHRVTVVGALGAHERIERRALRPGGQAGPRLNTLTDVLAVGLPRGAIGELGERGVEGGLALFGFEVAADAERGAGGRDRREAGWDPVNRGSGQGDERREDQ